MNIYNEQRIAGAMALAQRLHEGQMRKSDPNVSVLHGHLTPVSHLVREYGGTAEAIMAALLHDAVEDCDEEVREQIVSVCGPEVLALVEECTEPGTGSGYAHKAPWRERKEGYLRKIEENASPGGLLISIADKTQQAEELRDTVAVKGDATYNIFKQGKGGTLWFFSELSRAYHNRVCALSVENTPIAALLTRFDVAVASL